MTNDRQRQTGRVRRCTRTLPFPVQYSLDLHCYNMALTVPAMQGDASAIKSLLEKGKTSVDDADPYGDTGTVFFLVTPASACSINPDLIISSALHHACQYGHRKVVQLLIKFKAGTNFDSPSTLTQENYSLNKPHIFGRHQQAERGRLHCPSQSCLEGAQWHHQVRNRSLLRFFVG